MNGITFVERIKKILNEKDIKQTSMLLELGLPKSAIANWEQRGNIPAADVVLKIANYLGVSMEYLLTGETTQTPNFQQFEKLPEEELKKYKIVQMDIDDLANYDEQIMLGNYRLLNENNKQVIKQIINNLIQSQQN